MPRKLIKSEEIILLQKHMSMGAFVWLIIAMMTVQWMTLDMYLPALPVLKEEFGASEAVLNFSLNSDLILCAIGTLVGGTISDKYGRRPIMLLGLALSAAALLMAAMSQGIVMLTIMRGLCGLGGGFALTVASAIIRDSFEGDSFQMVTTLTQSAAIIGPIVAPAAGAFLIEYLSWRWIFIVLGTATVLTLIPFFFTLETWPAEKRQVGSVWQATLQSFNLVRRFEFVIFMVVALMITLPQWAYLGTCSYIYYDEFGVSNLEYSVLYALAALSAFFAPFLYVWVSRRTSGRRTVEFIMGFLLLAIILLILIGHRGPILFMIATVPLMMSEAMIRSMSMVVVLEEYPDEAGSASALIGFLAMMIGVLSTAVATLNWPGFILAITVISAFGLVTAAIAWRVIIRKRIYSRQLGL